MYNQYQVKFRYADAYSHWEWRNQQCTVAAESEFDAKSRCIEIYGLGDGCSYEIISVTKL